MPGGPAPTVPSGIPPDKRTTAYENIFGRPSAKPKGPQPQWNQTSSYRSQPAPYPGNQRWNPNMASYPAYAAQPYRDHSMMAAGSQQPHPSQPPPPKQLPHQQPQHASHYYSSPYSNAMGSAEPNFQNDYSDRRISRVPSIASSDTRMSLSNFSQFNGSSAADSYRSATPTLPPSINVYAGHHSHQTNGGPSLAHIATAGYPNPNAPSPRASQISLVHPNTEPSHSYHLPHVSATDSYSVDGLADDLGSAGLNNPNHKDPPRLPSIEFADSDQDADKASYWFDSKKTSTSSRLNNDALPESVGWHASATAASPPFQAISTFPTKASSTNGEEHDIHLTTESDGYSQGFFENLMGARSAASSIYGDGRRRGSFESDRQSIANSVYTLPATQSASRNFFNPNASVSSNSASGFLAQASGISAMMPYAGNGSAVWDRPARVRTTSAATQVAQTAYAPGYANQNSNSTDHPDSFRDGITTQRSEQHRSLSFGQAATRPTITAPPSPHGSVSGVKPQRSGSNRKGPIVYPALLSRIAEALRTRIALSERTKDGLTYSDAFDGREAVDKIAYIIKTTDRNLALLLGRALDAQKFFHDVTYDHRLRDSPNEIYQFKVRVTPTGFGTEPAYNGNLLDPHAPIRDNSSASLAPTPSMSSVTSSKLPNGSIRSPAATTPATSIYNNSNPSRPAVVDDDDDDDALPTGVFTLLTDCYSPTCSRDRLCYSIACPRRLEQQTRLNLKPQPGLKRSVSKESLGDTKQRGTLWAESVSKDIFDSLDDTERKRQEAINEVIYTERDFVADLEYLRDQWIKPLRSRDIIPEVRKDDFVTQVFWNVLEIHAVNSKMSEMLSKRQKKQAVVERIGDILLENAPNFQPFVKYGAHQLYGKYEFEKEKASNTAFTKFVDETERLPQSRKLELNGYLTKPTTRLARYPLLLEQVIKYTPQDHPDKQTLARVVKVIKEFLTKVNIETGKSENRFNLAQLDQQLVFKQGEAVDLRLRDEQRELVFKGPLKKRGGTQSESAELQVFLFDHALLMVKPKVVNKHELFKVYRKPIPLELLIVTIYDEVPTGKGNSTRPKSVMSRTSTGTRLSVTPSTAPKQDAKTGYALTYTYLGKKGYSMTLWASTFVSRRKWFEHIESRQEILRQRSNIFDTITLSEAFFVGPNKANCSVPFDFGRRIIYGTDDGVYLSDLREKARPPTKVLPLPGVTQVDVLEEYQILIVLADKSVHTFTLDALDPSDPMGSLKRGRRIWSHVSFFRAGICLGRTLVCMVKSSSLSSTIRTLEPIEQNARGKKQPTFKKLLQGGQDTLRVFKEFYIPTESSSIHFLKTKLCVGCTKGFEIVDLETLDTQGLLDPADSSLDFVHRKENVKPIAIYRISGEFLLCYDEFAFYVNKNGWRAKGNWIIHWEGSPTSFAYHHPYVLAFEPNFVEVRHVETGALHQVITGVNLRCLFADVPPPPPRVSQQQNAQAMVAMQSNPSYGSMMTPYGRPLPRQNMGQFGAFPGARPGFPPGTPIGVPPMASPAGSAGGPMYAARPAIGPGPQFVTGPGGQQMYNPGFPPRPPAMPYAFTQAHTPHPAPPQRNPVWESVAASRNQIVFVGDTTVFCVRLHAESENGKGSDSGSERTLRDSIV